MEVIAVVCLVVVGESVDMFNTLFSFNGSSSSSRFEQQVQHGAIP